MKEYFRTGLFKLSFVMAMTLLCQFSYGQCNDEEGMKAYNDKKYEEAITALKKCHLVHLRLPYAISVYNVSNSTKEEQKNALEKLESIPPSNLDYKEARYYLGLFYKNGKGFASNDSIAIERFLQSGNDKALYELALLYEKFGKEKDAIEYFEMVANSQNIDESKKGYANFKLGDYYEKKGNIDLALSYYEKARVNGHLKAGERYEELLKTSEEFTFALKNINNDKPIARTNVRIDGVSYPINGEGLCSFPLSRETKIKGKELEIEVTGYQKGKLDPSTMTVFLIPNNIWSKLTDTKNEQYARLNLKVGWGANKMNFNDRPRNIESGWGNQFNAELNVNFFTRGKHSLSLLFLGIGFHTNSYPFSKIDTYYYENLSYKTAYIPIGLKWQIPKLHFLYLNVQSNLAYNFGTVYKNYLLDYELKDNNMIKPFQFEILFGLSLMKKGWGGVELNYGFSASSVLNDKFKQTINDIEFEPFYGVDAYPRRLILNVIIFIPGIK